MTKDGSVIQRGRSMVCGRKNRDEVVEGCGDWMIRPLLDKVRPRALPTGGSVQGRCYGKQPWPFLAVTLAQKQVSTLHLSVALPVLVDIRRSSPPPLGSISLTLKRAQVTAISSKHLD
jgi:hypothetical protein